MAEQIGFGDIAEWFVQAGNLGPRHLFRAGTLDGEIDESRRAAIAGNLVHGLAVDPGLNVDEVRRVAGQLAIGVRKGEQRRIAGVLRFQREIERLTEVLRQIAEGIGAMQRRGWIIVLEHLVAGILEALAELLPGGAKRLVIGAVAKGHLPAPFLCVTPAKAGVQTYSNDSNRSFHSGFISSITRSFQRRFHSFICFSRRIADSMSGASSYQTRVLHPYCFVKPSAMPSRCCQTLWIRSLVTPM